MTAKSPISWGISWAAMAIVTMMPLAGEIRKAPAMAAPSMALCRVSPRMSSGTTGWEFFSLGCGSFWWAWQWNHWMKVSSRKKVVSPSRVESRTRA